MKPRFSVCLALSAIAQCLQLVLQLKKAEWFSGACPNHARLWFQSMSSQIGTYGQLQPMLSSPPWQGSTCLASKDVMTACRKNNWPYYRSAPTSVALECLLELPVETREIFDLLGYLEEALEVFYNRCLHA